MLMKHTYKFSIVCAVYNTAKYLDEMIESVLTQDIGFEENVQLILVDDGSEDGSTEICHRYVKSYPNNIMHIKCSHRGVSYARNRGIEEAGGEYVGFLDSDDKLASNALQEIQKFTSLYKDEVDLIAIPMYFFDYEEGEHILNYKFKQTQVIDITNQFENIQLSAASAFIKREVLKRFKFNLNLKYAEDAELVNKIILIKGKYGVVSNTKYYYRKRSDQSSTIQNSYNKAWCVDSIKLFSKEMLELANKMPRSYTLYMHYLIMYDLKWKINQLKNIKASLLEEEYAAFKKEVISIIKEIKIQAIIKQSCLRQHRKLLLLLLKYSRSNSFDRGIFKILERM